ncbi:hypothetical protein [Alkalihalobacterium bogoriense]|uniref:hypothetical protein n=1 Tax=Alkalihalobacterium bogoriense TaxID=246272 RepID=UPI00047AAE3E|nr:hypothetical protein [Alkalihalobacterium bogoriense]
MNSRKETWQFMKAKGKAYNLIIQPLFFSGITTITMIIINFLFLWYDFGLSKANDLFVNGILSGWFLLLFLFLGMYIILALLNGIRWIYYKNKM